MTDQSLTRRVQLLRELLASDLANLVESGDLTEAQANEWLASEAEWIGSWFN